MGSRSTGTSTLYHVGCSAGFITALAAPSGLFAIALDSNWELLSDARKKCKANLSLTYVHFVVTPQSVAVLPVCDVVLCLSIYHQWHCKFGHEGAQQILQILGTKARKRLFFEPASRQSKYGPKTPTFTYHDEGSIIVFNI